MPARFVLRSFRSGYARRAPNFVAGGRDRTVANEFTLGHRALPVTTPSTPGLAPFRRFWTRYVRRNVPYYLVGAVMLVATNYALVRIPRLAGDAVDALALATPAGAARARDAAWELVVLGVGVVLVRTLSRILFFNPARHVEYRVGVDVFAHVLSLPAGARARRKVGELVSLATNDATALRLLAGFASLQVCNVTVAIPLHVHQMWSTDPLLTAASLVPVLAGAVYMRWTIRRFYGLVRRSMEYLGRLSDRVLESYAGVQAIRVLGAEAAALARFDERNDAYLKLQLRIAGLRAFAMPVLSVAGLLATAVVLWVGGRRVVQGVLTVGDLVTFSALLLSLVSVLTSLSWVLASLSRGTASLGRVDELLGAEVPDERAGRPFPSEAPPAIEVQGLSFAYHGGKPVLEDVSLRVPAGGTLGIVGPTGAGKSTLLRLLARIYEPPPGSVRVAGMDLRTVRRADLRRKIAFVPQQPFLFSTTIRENILFGLDPQAQLDEKEVARRLDAVIEMAALADDISAMSQGLDTVVGERGVTLSGGQRQRIALARALIRGAPILLLDDVLSAVDQGTEARLVRAIAGLHDGGFGGPPPTTVIVSHRVSVLAHADAVAVLERGRVVACGTHDELRSQGGYYAEICARQAAGGEASP